MSAQWTLKDRLASRNPANALARAKTLDAAGEIDRAFRLFVIAAEAGITEATYQVGMRYLTGAGVVRNAIESARWFTKAAEKGDLLSQRHLAGLYMAGLQEDTVRTSDAQLFTENQNKAADFDSALRWVLPPAQAGDTEAQVMAGYIYVAGAMHLRDEAQAKFWFGKAAESGTPAGHLGLGIITLREADTDTATFAAVEHIRQAAAADLSSGHYYLGFIYEKAVGVHADLALAAQHYGLAAKGSLRAGMAKYGYMRFNGIGVEANRVEGESWLRRAGLGGDPEAAAFVADIYATRGGELPPNFAEAAIWYRLAAAAGHKLSARALGTLYAEGNGVPRDPDEAAIWFRRSAESGNPQAQSDLASLLLSGRTNPKITEQPPVHEWFEQAAEAGDLIAAFNFAVCLAQGVGVPQDEARAAIWFRRAAEGVLNAQHWYGRILAQGRGIERNPEEARFWLQKCADAELPDALVDLANLHLNGEGGPCDHEMARQLFERAAKRGQGEAMFALGAMYGGGHDIPTDRAQALSWYRAAAEKGHPLAALMLGRYLAKGIATPMDPEGAKHWFTQALKAGLAEAQGDLDQLIPPAPSDDISGNEAAAAE
jgi:TPR repeat protein